MLDVQKHHDMQLLRLGVEISHRGSTLPLRGFESHHLLLLHAAAAWGGDVAAQRVHPANPLVDRHAHNELCPWSLRQHPSDRWAPQIVNGIIYCHESDEPYFSINLILWYDEHDTMFLEYDDY